MGGVIFSDTVFSDNYSRPLYDAERSGVETGHDGLWPSQQVDDVIHVTQHGRVIYR
jgi:hypothetical protein